MVQHAQRRKKSNDWLSSSPCPAKTVYFFYDWLKLHIKSANRLAFLLTQSTTHFGSAVPFLAFHTIESTPPPPSCFNIGLDNIEDGLNR